MPLGGIAKTKAVQLVVADAVAARGVDVPVATCSSSAINKPFTVPVLALLTLDVVEAFAVHVAAVKSVYTLTTYEFDRVVVMPAEITADVDVPLVAPPPADPTKGVLAPRYANITDTAAVPDCVSATEDSDADANL
jgi:hypothetical protein